MSDCSPKEDGRGRDVLSFCRQTLSPHMPQFSHRVRKTWRVAENFCFYKVQGNRHYRNTRERMLIKPRAGDMNSVLQHLVFLAEADAEKRFDRVHRHIKSCPC